MPATTFREPMHSLKTLASRLTRAAFSERFEKPRFLLVGAWNTVVGYVIFVAVFLLAGEDIGAVSVLVISYCLAVPHSFITQRVLAFRAMGPWLPQFGRFCASNTLIFISNLVFLPIVIATTPIEPIVAQTIFVAASTIVGYIAHRHYSFSK